MDEQTGSDQNDAKARADTATRTVLNPFPDHRDLYLLVAGLLLGVLLGPAVLGQVAPGVYDRVFVGVGPATAELREAEAEHAAALRQLQETGVSDAAMAERAMGFEQQRMLLQAQAEQERLAHLGRLTGRMLALVFAVVGVMVIESLVSPQPEGGKRQVVPTALSRLVTIRYALAALWLAVVVAQPTLLGQVPVVFAGAVIVVALVVAFVPLGGRSAGSEA
ncbi:hypothetical protein ACERK3_14325 [Phycisphaerales bacterium AB-hyl4]|uniref:DUF4400 domain-containing protein n=1 Tax=Natronomicrosphaera hydrolytica TaxID=3242702 RepID=A0ABV4U786_9BACT